MDLSGQQNSSRVTGAKLDVYREVPGSPGSDCEEVYLNDSDSDESYTRHRRTQAAVRDSMRSDLN